MLPCHHVNCMIDHVKHDNAQEPYIYPNYNWHKGSRTPKWIIEIDKIIITNLEGKKSKRPFGYGLQDYIRCFSTTR